MDAHAFLERQPARRRSLKPLEDGNYFGIPERPENMPRLGQRLLVMRGAAQNDLSGKRLVKPGITSVRCEQRKNFGQRLDSESIGVIRRRRRDILP